jgi:hypothetical protein
MIRLALFLLVALAHAPAWSADWEEIGDDDGIRVSRKEIADSPIIAFRGEAIVDASIAKIAQVLDDTRRKVEWVASAAEARDVRTVGPFERIEYNHTTTPIVLKDRDFVYKVKTEVDPQKQQIRIAFHSVEDALVPVYSKCVRGRLVAGKYVLTAIDRDRTRVLVEVQADPMGAVPKWIANVFQRSWPRRTLQGIRRQAARSDVPEHSLAKELLERRRHG